MAQWGYSTPGDMTPSRQALQQMSQQLTMTHHKRNKPPNKERTCISRIRKNESIWKSVGNKCLQYSKREGEGKRQHHCIQIESIVLSKERGGGRAQLCVWPECTVCFQRVKYPRQEMLLVHASDIRNYVEPHMVQ